MQLVRIAGPAGDLRQLHDVAGLDVERTSARRLDGERWQVSAYASEEALAELDARGLGVELVVAPEELDAQRRDLYGRIARAPDEDE